MKVREERFEKNEVVLPVFSLFMVRFEPLTSDKCIINVQFASFAYKIRDTIANNTFYASYAHG